MTLQELIDSSRAERDRRRQAEADRKRDDDARYQALFNQVMAAAFARYSSTVPAQLHPFVIYGGENPTEAVLRRYPGTFDPCDFKISAAPGLQEIFFTTSGVISIGQTRFPDWTEAIAAASDPPAIVTTDPA